MFEGLDEKAFILSNYQHVVPVIEFLAENSGLITFIDLCSIEILKNTFANSTLNLLGKLGFSMQNVRGVGYYCESLGGSEEDLINSLKDRIMKNYDIQFTEIGAGIGLSIPEIDVSSYGYSLGNLLLIKVGQDRVELELIQQPETILALMYFVENGGYVDNVCINDPKLNQIIRLKYLNFFKTHEDLIIKDIYQKFEILSKTKLYKYGFEIKCISSHVGYTINGIWEPRAKYIRMLIKEEEQRLRNIPSLIASNYTKTLQLNLGTDVYRIQTFNMHNGFIEKLFGSRLQMHSKKPNFATISIISSGETWVVELTTSMLEIMNSVNHQDQSIGIVRTGSRKAAKAVLNFFRTLPFYGLKPRYREEDSPYNSEKLVFPILEKASEE